jgi:hypothetical protein
VVAANPYFAECGRGLCAGLFELGNHAELMEEVPASSVWDAILVIGIHLFPNMLWSPDTLLLGIQTEQLPIRQTQDSRLLRNRNRFKSVMGFYDLLFEWNPGVYVAGAGGARFLPYGCMKRPFIESGKQHDLAFIGNVGTSARRREMLNRLGCEFDLHPESSPGFGGVRDEVVRSSKILLNIHHYEGGGIESPRLFDYLSLGAFVLSEGSEQSYPLLDGRDFIGFNSYEDLVCKIRCYLADDDERRRIATQGHETATQFGYHHSAGLISLELAHLLARRASRMHRFGSWLGAKLRSDMFQVRDFVSLKRRAMFQTTETRKNKG